MTDMSLFTKLGLWVISEIVLTVLGYDDLADFSEAMAIAQEHSSRTAAYATVVVSDVTTL
ncbi:MAG: hypothetical protein AAFX40_09150 [Cyanobacteria bacterium J06639_1]